MSEISIVIGHPKSGKSYSLKKERKSFVGKSIGEKIRGELIDMPGYEFEITGGSDDSGFAMRRDVLSNRAKILVSGKSVGFQRKTHKGEKRRVTVAGKMIHEKTAQINLKVLKDGKQSIEELLNSGNTESEAQNE